MSVSVPVPAAERPSRAALSNGRVFDRVGAPAVLTRPVPPAGTHPGAVSPGPSRRSFADRVGQLVTQAVTAALVVGPPAAVAVAVARKVRPTKGSLAMFAGSYAIGGVGVVIGLHRYLTHRSFTARRSVRAGLTAAAAVAVEGSAVSWVANHRRHHQTADTPDDPHSPHHHGDGVAGVVKGFAHAHAGWLFTPTGIDPQRYAPDLVGDRLVTRVDRLWPVIAVSSVLVPAAVGYFVDGRRGAVNYAVWGGLARIAFGHHVTWSVNSWCHLFGPRPFITRDQSRDASWLAVPSLGGSWHNGHHAEPTSAREGLLVGQVDIASWLIRLAEHAGLVWDVHWVDPDKVARKLADPSLASKLKPLPAPVRRPLFAVPSRPQGVS